MSPRIFFLGWQSRESRAWFPIGRLDAPEGGGGYEFGYTRGAREAAEKHGFEPLYDFPNMGRSYHSEELFPLFKNRIMTPGRHGFQEYLKLLDFEGMKPDPLEIMAVDGGYRATDNYQVFPKIAKDENGCFQSRFFLHGWRHTNDAARTRLEKLVAGENLYVTVELTNPETTTAVQIQTEDYQMLGWAPRYLVHDLVHAMAHSPGVLKCKVVRFNSMPAPSKQRVLIELCGQWPSDYSPMEGPDFELINANEVSLVS